MRFTTRTRSENRRRAAARTLLIAACALVIGMGCSWPTAGQAAQDGRGRFEYWWTIAGKEAHRVGPQGMPLRTDVAVLYEQDAGRYPRYYDGKPENGGLPQRADINAHLTELRNDIRRVIPDPNFSGWAVLDYESWDPLWELTKPVYKEQSRELVRQNNPFRPAADIERLAKVGYESAARRFMLETINAAKRERPRAKWGYYALPWPTYARFEKEIRWLWEASGALYPCIYSDRPAVADGAAVPDGGQTISAYRADITGRVALAKKFAGGKPVVPFAWVRYDWTSKHAGGKFVGEEELRAMLDVPREAGADGLILWNEARSPSDATELQTFMQQKLAPVLREYSR